MQFKVFPDDTLLSSAAADAICGQLRQNPRSLLCLAAGHSSLGVFQELVRRYRQNEVDFSQAGFLAMDEWLGMNRSTPGSCSDFLIQNFLSQVNFPPERVRLIDGKASDVQAECKAVRSSIAEAGGLDFILLGMGMNGHLALNEPGVDFTLSVHLTQLDGTTKKVGQKYFDSAPELTGGLTIGFADIAAAKNILLVVNGERKSQILQKVMESPVTNLLPATGLKDLPNAALWCDRAAASLCPAG